MFPGVYSSETTSQRLSEGNLTIVWSSTSGGTSDGAGFSGKDCYRVYYNREKVFDTGEYVGRSSSPWMKALDQLLEKLETMLARKNSFDLSNETM